MKNDLYKHEKSDSVKWVLTLIAFLIVGVLLAAVITQGFKTANPWGWLDKEHEHNYVDGACAECGEEQPKQTGGAVIGESTGNNMQLMKKTLTSAQYAEYGVSPLAESAYVLTATITPANAYVKGVNWSAVFVDAESEWAAGKSVEDYLTVTPDAENSQSATVTCLMSFGEQIKITASSQDNEDIKAECIVDYAARFRNLSGSLTAKRTIASTQVKTQTYSFGQEIVQMDVTSGGRNQVYENVFGGHHSFSTGTVIEQATEKYTLVISDGLKTAMQAQGLTVTFTEKEITKTTGMMFDKVCMNTHLGISSSSADWEKLMNAVGNNAEDYDFLIRYSVSTEHDATSTSCKVKLNAASMISVEGLNLDKTTLLF